MSTAQNAYENLKLRKLAYWKLYHGNNKVSQCERDENPDADAETAAKLFEEEINTRLVTPGNYTVNVYRNINGEKAGFKYTFTISGTEQMSNIIRSQSQSDDLRTQIKREIEIEMSLKRIEDKVDSILQYIVANTTEDKKDDNEALKLITGLVAQGIRQKAAVPPGQSFASLK